MLEIAVCEDERYQQGELEELLYSLGRKLNIRLEVDVYENGEALLSSVEKGNQYDLIYLDVEMEGINGVAVARRLRETDRTVQIVYVTNYEKYIRQSTDTMPSGYITKPVDQEEFEKTFVRINRWIENKDEYYRFQSENVPCKTLIRDILYFRSNLRKIEIVCEDRTYIEYGKLDQIEKTLEGSTVEFLRIHQSYLVNSHKIEKYGHNWVKLITGEKLSMSRGKRKNGVEEKLERT